ncbi:S24 family peptidase [Dyella sp.]|uniref:XRE family transcriptional regulator n=1 Tax=Dyella sp. TaxID=1869338 RepID=UPI002FD960D5
MKPDSEVPSRGFASARGKVTNGRWRRTTGLLGNLGIGHAEALQISDKGGPSFHTAQHTVFRNKKSTAFRDGFPLQFHPMNTIGDRIKFAREHGPAGKVSRKELATYAGIAYSTLSDLEYGESNSTTALYKIARRLKVRVDWLETGRGPMESEEEENREEGWSDILGVKQAAALGDGAVPDEYAETHKLKFRSESLRRKHLNAKNLAVVYGKGDSMEPTIKDGDAILFDTSDTQPRDGGLFVITYDGELFAKRLMELDGMWYAKSDNGTDPRWRKPKRLDPSRRLEIAGRIRWIAGWID